MDKFQEKLTIRHICGLANGQMDELTSMNSQELPYHGSKKLTLNRDFHQ